MPRPPGLYSGGRQEPGQDPAHPCQITADDEQFEEDYLFGAVTNTISLGGVLKLDPEKVLLDDGMYELLLVKNPTNALEAQAMLTALMTQNFDGPLVKMFHARISPSNPATRSAGPSMASTAAPSAIPTFSITKTP